MTVYEIRVKGYLDRRWPEWSDGLEFSNLETGEAVLCGEVVDRAALRGVLAKVRDLVSCLISVSSAASDRDETTTRPAQTLEKGV